MKVLSLLALFISFNIQASQGDLYKEVLKVSDSSQIESIYTVDGYKFDRNLLNKVLNIKRIDQIYFRDGTILNTADLNRRNIELRGLDIIKKVAGGGTSSGGG